MARFDQQILEALAGQLDPYRFEECACDLLRDVFPGLFPIRGGDDAGMDGGIADGKGEPFPLVCTTGKDVIGNLTKNLRSYKAMGGTRRKVALATSQELTPKRRRNLFERAREREFELIGPYDRHAMRDLLYVRPDWCLKLLGLTGTPSALSTVPRSNRPSPELELVGREADLEWLRSTEGDRLLVGQPGSGKTYLLRALVREGRGLFLVDDDRTAIANAVREGRPEAILVDDAHRKPEILESLRQLREELRQEQEVPIFSIVATCWPGEENEINAAMGTLLRQKIQPLELMIRREILEIIVQLLPDWNDEFLRMLVKQASNKPGIAVTLAWLCLRGGWRDVVDGQALWSMLEPTFRELVGSESADFLGVVSLGGRGGVTPDAAGVFLDWGRQKVRATAKGLAAGGVLTDLRDRRLVVEPADLRSTLIRRTFFEGVAAFDYRELLAEVSSRDAAILEIVRAAHLGAEISGRELRELAQSTEDRDVWRSMAMFPEHSAWALENAPFDAVLLAAEALQHVAGMAIQLLLERAVGESGPLHSSRGHPLRILQTWLQKDVSPMEHVARRRQVIVEARSFLQNGGDRQVAIYAACLSLSYDIQDHRLDPLGTTAILIEDILPLQAIDQLVPLWQQVCELIQDLDGTAWQHLREMLQKWIWPSTARVTTEEEKHMHAFASKVIRDLSPMARQSQGLSAELRQLARRVGSDFEIEIDPDFELLYLCEPENLDDWLRREKERRGKVRKLAHTWAVESKPRDLARHLVDFEKESSWLQNSQSWSVTLCSFLAEYVERPSSWLEAFLDEQTPSRLVLPFLKRITRERQEGWEALVERCIAEADYVRIAVQIALSMIECPEHLLRMALSHVSGWPSLVENLALRRELPIPTLLILLRHPDVEVGLHAATGEWYSEPKRKVKFEVRDAWRLAILRSAEDRGIDMGNYKLRDILTRNGNLACEWLGKRLSSGATAFSDRDLKLVMADLDDQQRLVLLDQVSARPMMSSFLSQLVDRRPEVYRKLLGLDRLREHHLCPLEGAPDAAWAEIAILALGYGYTPAVIAKRLFQQRGAAIVMIWGHDQSHWRQWDDAFAILEEHSDPRLREVARFGRKEAQNRIRAVGARQHEFELSGRVGIPFGLDGLA